MKNSDSKFVINVWQQLKQHVLEQTVMLKLSLCVPILQANSEFELN